MTPRGRSAGSRETGFVLIGVVIFVLALTIIGLSLYSLSSYEADFLQRSIDREQAFQSALGGIERAKFALTQTSDLASAAAYLPENVTTTVAIQNGESTGVVRWTSVNDVTIRATAEVNDQRRTVEGRFSPSTTLNYYSSLTTVSEGIDVMPWSPLPPFFRIQTVQLDGPVWESSPQDTNTWKPRLHPPQPSGIRKSPEVPVPDVSPFLSPSGRIATASLAVKVMPPLPGILTYTLDASGTPGVPRYFRGEDTDANFSVTTFPRPACTIVVRGLAVWLLPRGAMFFQGTRITGDPDTDCLVVIAGPMTGTWAGILRTTSSICFFGSLQADIPVILVSSGEVLFWQENDAGESGYASDLAIFARSARFMGPASGLSPPATLYLRRDLTGRLNLPSGGGAPSFLDALAGQGALPNAASTSGRRLDLLAGSWRASGP